jgi:predicted  nucleic acid-binding Zn-ribbon protein
MTGPTDRDALLDELLAAPLDRFVEERNRLARELRSAGDRDTATWLASLRRPAPYIWALDQVARRDPQRMRTLTNLGRRLHDAQSRAVQDRAAAREMQELSRELQRAVEEAVRQGVEVLRDAGHGATADAALSMTATLRGALAGDDATREELEHGRLLAPVQADFGFGVAGGDVVATPAARPRADPAERSNADPHAARLAEQRAAAAEAAGTAAAADREVFQRRTEQRRADDRVAELRTRMQDLQAELSDAEAASRTAADGVRSAVEAARAARREADRLRSALPPD